MVFQKMAAVMAIGVNAAVLRSAFPDAENTGRGRRTGIFMKSLEVEMLQTLPPKKWAGGACWRISGWKCVLWTVPCCFNEI